MPIFYKRLILVIFSLSVLSCSAIYAQDTIKSPPRKPKSKDILSRMDFGGYLGAQFGDVTYIEVSPIASYRVTKSFHTGLGLTYQYYKVNYAGAPDYSTSSYGCSVFGRYFIWRDLFAHIEYAPLYVNYYDISMVKGGIWVHDVMIGGGYRQWIGDKAFMSLMLLWNVNESYYSPYSNPIIRIGFGIGL